MNFTQFWNQLRPNEFILVNETICVNEDSEARLDLTKTRIHFGALKTRVHLNEDYCGPLRSLERLKNKNTDEVARLDSTRKT